MLITTNVQIQLLYMVPIEDSTSVVYSGEDNDIST
jgi:hypothetical protein